MKRNVHVGIDLGTTNSTVSIINVERDGKISPHTIDIQQLDDTGLGLTFDQIVPSALFIDEDNIKNVGKYAIKMIDTYPKRVLREVKRHIGVLKNGQPAKWIVDEEEYTPEVVSSYVLKKLKKDTEKYLQKEVDRVVITVPANFNISQVSATITAAKLAGFDENNIYTIAEPTAALLDYLNIEKQMSVESRRIDISSGKKRLLVFDLGGGTCDVSILEVYEDKNGDIHMKELSISQYTELGGMDFDTAIVNKFLWPQLQKSKGITQEQFRNTPGEVKTKLMSMLKQIAENAKKNFSNKIDAQISMSDDEIDYFTDSEKFDGLKYRQMTVGLPPEYTHTFTITKKEYDQCIAGFLYDSQQQKNIETPILSALDTSIVPIKKEDIDHVFLVGGMTNYPTIQKRIYEIFDKRIKPTSSINPMLSVSRGAAVYNYYQDKIIIDGPEYEEKELIGGSNIILPCNIYIEVIAGDPVTLLEKNTAAGVAKILDGEFVVAGKSGQDKIGEMELNLFTAESKDSMRITELESAVLKFKRPVPTGTKVSIKAEYTLNREVNISAWLTENECEKIDVTIGKSKLSDERIKDIKNDENVR